YEFSDAVNLSLAYLASEAENPTSGLTGGPFVALAQFTLKPTNTIALGLTYVRSYNGLDAGVAGVGSTYSNDPFDGESYTSDSYGLAANFQINPKIALGGWAGYTRAEAVSGVNDGSNASIFYYAVTLAFPDLLREGNLGGIVVGLPPKVTSNDINDREDRDSSLHLEAFYRFQVAKNIGITPGVLVITNPEHNEDNDTIYVGTIRTTLSF
ncbi:iron uptake porin, partial [Chroococcidiopsis cubana]